MTDNREPHRGDDPSFATRQRRPNTRRHRDEHGLDIGRHLIWVLLALAITVLVGWW